MTIKALLVAPPFAGGEGVYQDLLRTHGPTNVTYSGVGGFHEGGPGVTCRVPWEMALNQLVRPRAIPDVGFRALRLRDHFDLVHVHAHPVRLSGLGRTPLVMSEGSSSVVYLRDYLGWGEERLERALRRSRRLYRLVRVQDRLLAMERATSVYVFSDWARRLNIDWGADADKLKVVPPGFPVPEPVARSGHSDFTFLFVGTDFERKGGFDVVEAFDRLSDAYPSAKVVFAGSDPWTRNPDRVLHEWVDSARRSRVLARLDSLRQRGVATVHEALALERVRNELYPEADAFVMPTLAEGFGFTNVEAMSYGLPVISSTVGPIPEVVLHGETGLLVPPGNVDELEQAMRQLLDDRAAAAAMGASGRDVFLGAYTLDHFTQSLGDLYQRALETA